MSVRPAISTTQRSPGALSIPLTPQPIPTRCSRIRSPEAEPIPPQFHLRIALRRRELRTTPFANRPVRVHQGLPAPVLELIRTRVPRTTPTREAEPIRT